MAPIQTKPPTKDWIFSSYGFRYNAYPEEEEGNLIITDIIKNDMESSRVSIKCPMLNREAYIMGEKYRILTAKNADAEIHAIVVYYLKFGCIWVSDMSISTEYHKILLKDLMRYLFMNGNDDRSLIAFSVNHASHCILSEAVNDISNEEEEKQTVVLTSDIPFELESDERQVKYFMTVHAHEHEHLPWVKQIENENSTLPHFQLEYPQEEEEEDESEVEESGVACDGYIGFSSEDPVIFLRLSTDYKYKVRYPMGFHPSNHWKKNKKGLYMKKKPRYNSGGGFHGRGGGSRNYGGGRGRGGYHRNEFNPDEQPFVFVACAALTSVAVFATWLIMKAK